MCTIRHGLDQAATQAIYMPRDQGKRDTASYVFLRNLTLYTLAAGDLRISVDAGLQKGNNNPGREAWPPSSGPGGLLRAWRNWHTRQA